MPALISDVELKPRVVISQSLSQVETNFQTITNSIVFGLFQIEKFLIS